MSGATPGGRSPAPGNAVLRLVKLPRMTYVGSLHVSSFLEAEKKSLDPEEYHKFFFNYLQFLHMNSHFSIIFRISGINFIRG